MLGKVIIGTMIGLGTFGYVFPPILRFIVRYEDKNTKEWEENKNRKWLEERKDKPVIPNSRGENYF